MHWTLTNSIHAGDPNETIIFRQRRRLLQRERLISPPDATSSWPPTSPSTSATLYLLVPGTGIVTHTFTPDPTLTCD